MVARHLKFGSAGEEMAGLYLKSKGYEIIARNWKKKSGELDIVCQKDKSIVFVEVKTRSETSRGLPAEAVDKKKQKKLFKAAQLFLSQNKLWGHPCRFDLISIMFEKNKCTLEHMPNAFEYPSMGGSHSYWQPW